MSWWPESYNTVDTAYVSIVLQSPSMVLFCSAVCFSGSKGCSMFVLKGKLWNLHEEVMLHSRPLLLYSSEIDCLEAWDWDIPACHYFKATLVHGNVVSQLCSSFQMVTAWCSTGKGQECNSVLVSGRIIHEITNSETCKLVSTAGMVLWSAHTRQT